MVVFTGVASGRSELRQVRIGEFRIQSEHAGSGTPVVLLHGLAGSRRWWRFTTPVLARHYRVHVPELVGFGGSRGSRQPAISEMAVVLAEWLREMELDSTALVGHSMGGQIAVHLAAKHVEPARLALVCTSGVPRPWSLNEAARLLAGAIPPRSWGAPAFVPVIAADAVRAGPMVLLRAARNLLADDVTALLPHIRCRTLVVWGGLDPLLPVAHGQAIARGIAGARLVVLPDAAHNPMCDRPAEFNRVLLDFLDEP